MAWAKPSIPTRLLRAALAALLVLLVAACAPHYADYSAFVRHPLPLASSAPYRLAPPDAVAFDSPVVREVDGHRETIRPDGKITLPLLGEVTAAGKTCQQLSDELSKRAQTYYKDANITVRIINFASKKIYVFGEVSVPGAYPYTGNNSVLGTLAQAQPTRLASTNNIQVLRPSYDGKLRKRMTIDLNQMVRTGNTSHDAILHSGDIIFVPPSALASVGLAIQQLLLPITPAANTVNGTNTINNGYGTSSPGR